MDTFIAILRLLTSSIVIIGVYYLLKAYVLRKLNVNKWAILGAAVVLFIVPIAVWPNMPNYVANYIIPGVFVVLLFWFMDLSGFIKKRSDYKTNTISTGTKKDKKKDVVIRPKAKPNRVKNNQK